MFELRIPRNRSHGWWIPHGLPLNPCNLLPYFVSPLSICFCFCFSSPRPQHIVGTSPLHSFGFPLKGYTFISLLLPAQLSKLCQQTSPPPNSVNPPHSSYNHNRRNKFQPATARTHSFNPFEISDLVHSFSRNHLLKLQNFTPKITAR